MKRRRGFFGALAVLLIVASTLLAGCGDDKPNGPLTTGDNQAPGGAPQGGYTGDKSDHQVD